MNKIYLYGFNGTYSGEPAYDWNSPEKGANHNCLIFLRQSKEIIDFDATTNEIRRFGFEGISGLRGNELKLEALNSDSYRGFSGFYESALQDGSCLVFYPNT